MDCPLYEYRMGHRPKTSGVADGLSEIDAEVEEDTSEDSYF